MKYLLLPLLLFTSCSPQSRLNRLIKNHPELSQSTTIIDTLRIRDTVRITSNTIDTLFAEPRIGDTVTIQNDSIIIKYVKVPGNTVYLKGTVKEMIIYRDKKVPYEKTVTIYKYSDSKKWLYKTLFGFEYWKLIGMFWIALTITLLIRVKR